MKKIIALVSVLVLCMACVGTAFAAASLKYRADYTIAAGKEGYSPSTIYQKSINRRIASYLLENFTVGIVDYPESVYVHMWNRQVGDQVTGRKLASVDNVLELVYITAPKSSETLKPVTYKPNSYYLQMDVIIKASFNP